VDNHAQAIAIPGCAAIAGDDARLAPLTKLCEFVQSYRQSLPNFVCQQETTTKTNWFGGPPVRKIDEQVTYADGVVSYSNPRVNGTPLKTDDWRTRAEFTSSGEFGNELTDLFQLPLAPRFRFERNSSFHGTEAVVFAFQVPQERNTFWRVTQRERAFFPEVRGTIWVDSKSARPLRIEMRSVRLPIPLQMMTAETHTEYDDVNLGEAGIHLLPVRGESNSCMRPTAFDPRERCFHNLLQFHDCRRFAAKARIVEVKP
jgi:hypothetical protein